MNASWNFWPDYTHELSFVSVVNLWNFLNVTGFRDRFLFRSPIVPFSLLQINMVVFYYQQLFNCALEYF